MVAVWYSADDRRRQLRRLAVACERLAVLYEREAADVAAVYGAISEEANRLVGATPDQQVLTALGSRLPARPAWLHPKFHEFQAPRSDWQEKVAQLRHGAEGWRPRFGVKASGRRLLVDDVTQPL